ncbi:MAG: COX15/CtaA family protein [Actinomycetota bacterium]|nr:COX15/CtaA family protein [Actinomycetota bacterium]
MSQVTAALVVLNIASGAAVRLTGSGLGCPDWPTCSRRHVTPALSFHPLMEFSNRMVVVGLVVVIGATAVASLVGTERRRDLVWLSWGLVGGVLAEAVAGGIVVYTKLNPYVVMGHFMVGIGLLAVATVLALRAGGPGGAGVPKVGRSDRRLAWAMVGVLAVALAAGTATTGAGPDGGSPSAVRLPVPLDDMARTHSLIVIAFGCVLLVALYRLYRDRGPESVQRRGHLLLGALVVQGLIGYTQFFTHLPPGLVEVHEVGAAIVVVALLQFVDSLYHRGGPVPAVGTEPAIHGTTTWPPQDAMAPAPAIPGGPARAPEPVR